MLNLDILLSAQFMRKAADIVNVKSFKRFSTRAATDPADPDLLITRIQNSRSGPVKELSTTKFGTKFRAFEIFSSSFDKIFSIKAVLKLFLKIFVFFLKIAKEIG